VTQRNSPPLAGVSRSLRKLTAKDWITALSLLKAAVDIVRALTGNG